MAEFSLRLLLAPLDELLAATKYLLSPRIGVQNNSKRRRHVDTFIIGVVVEVLARKVTFVTVNEVDLV